MKFIRRIFHEVQVTDEEKARLIRHLGRSVTQYESQPQHRDHRGVRSEIRQRVKKTLRQLKNALHHRDHHSDVVIRRQAKKLVGSVAHLPFEELAVKSSSLVGAMHKSSHREKEKLRQEEGRILNISQTLQVEEVRSVTRLQSVGRTNQLCVSKLSVARVYLKKIHAAQSELWIIRREGRDIGLLELHLRLLDGNETRTIYQCNTFGNECLHLRHAEAMKILRKLRVTESDVGTFTNVGALLIFLQGEVKRPLPLPVLVGEERYYVWRSKDQIAIATTTEKTSRTRKFIAAKMRWSYFHKSGGHWVEYWMNYLSLGQVIELMLESPRIRHALLKIR